MFTAVEVVLVQQHKLLLLEALVDLQYLVAAQVALEHLDLHHPQ
jgi:hypothetical protein